MSEHVSPIQIPGGRLVLSVSGFNYEVLEFCGDTWIRTHPIIGSREFAIERMKEIAAAFEDSRATQGGTGAVQMTNEQFELLASFYYRRYGRLYPGKDEPAASGRDSGDDENVRQVIDWQGGPFVSLAMHDMLTELLVKEAKLDAVATLPSAIADNFERIHQLETELKAAHKECGMQKTEAEFLRAALWDIADGDCPTCECDKHANAALESKRPTDGGAQ